MQTSKYYIYIAGLVSWLAYLFLAQQSQSYADATLSDLYITSAVSFCMSACTLLYYERKGLVIPLAGLMFSALLFRLTGLYAFPVLEDDFYRYLWDGYQFVERGSPYAFAPSYFFTDASVTAHFQDILDNINYPDIATVYGPTNQYLFALSYLIAPGEIWPLQLCMIGVDMGIILILSQIAKRNYLVLYAWSPLVIKEFAFTAHPDVLGVFFVFFAMLLINKKQLYLGAIMLALALGSKVFAIILIPFLLRFHIRAWLVFLSTTVLIALPFGLRAAWLPEGLSAMAGEWLFNAPIYTALQPLISVHTLKPILLSLFSMVWFIYWLYWVKRHDTVFKLRGDYIFLVFFLCIPAFNPWYLIWLLPFAVISPTPWAWGLSAAVLLSYISGINLSNGQLGLYQQPHWALCLEFIPVLMLILWRPWLRLKPAY